MIIVGMTREHELWDETAGFAENCSWSSGRRLAERMKAGGFSDWERIFAAVQDGKIAEFEPESGAADQLFETEI